MPLPRATLAAFVPSIRCLAPPQIRRDKHAHPYYSYAGNSVPSVFHRRRMVGTADFSALRSALRQTLRAGDAEWIGLRENLRHWGCLFLGRRQEESGPRHSEVP